MTFSTRTVYRLVRETANMIMPSPGDWVVYTLYTGNSIYKEAGPEPCFFVFIGTTTNVRGHDLSRSCASDGVSS